MTCVRISAPPLSSRSEDEIAWLGAYPYGVILYVYGNVIAPIIFSTRLNISNKNGSSPSIIPIIAITLADVEIFFVHRQIIPVIIAANEHK